jgi:hypothetical protein
MKNTTYSNPSYEIASLEIKIARLESAATRSVSRTEPDTAHLMRRSYDEICEEIISLKWRLSDLKIKARNGVPTSTTFDVLAA